jgi:hypothetical protein
MATKRPQWKEEIRTLNNEKDELDQIIAAGRPEWSKENPVVIRGKDVLIEMRKIEQGHIKSSVNDYAEVGQAEKRRGEIEQELAKLERKLAAWQ